MMLRRSRHLELDKFRSLNPRFNYAWLMFFGTQPPGISRAAVFFTEEEQAALADEVSAFVDGHFKIEVEQYDPSLHNSGNNPSAHKLAEMYGSSK